MSLQLLGHVWELCSRCSICFFGGQPHVKDYVLQVMRSLPVATAKHDTCVVVKIMGPFWIPIIVRHLIFRVPNKGP